VSVKDRIVRMSNKLGGDNLKKRNTVVKSVPGKLPLQMIQSVIDEDVPLEKMRTPPDGAEADEDFDAAADGTTDGPTKAAELIAANRSSIRSKFAIFQDMEKQKKKRQFDGVVDETTDPALPSIRSVRRYDRSSRSMTQPVTTDEVVSAERENANVKNAAKMKEEKERENRELLGEEREEKIAVDIRALITTIDTAAKVANKTEMRPKHMLGAQVLTDLAEEDQGDEFTNLPLSEKMKLWNRRGFGTNPGGLEESPDAANALDRPTKRRSRRGGRASQRNLTQTKSDSSDNEPVTNEELTSASTVAKPSPLAMTMFKPPEADQLGGLPIAAQREMIAQFAIAQHENNMKNNDTMLKANSEEHKANDNAVKDNSEDSGSKAKQSVDYPSPAAAGEQQQQQKQPPPPASDNSRKGVVPRQNSVANQSGGEEYFSAGSGAGSGAGSQSGSQYESPVDSPPASVTASTDKQFVMESSDGAAEQSDRDSSSCPPSGLSTTTKKPSASSSSPRFNRRRTEDKRSLKALKTNGENDWKTRVSPQRSTSSTTEGVEDIQLRDRSSPSASPGPSGRRPVSLADRLNLLQEAQAGWKSRVNESDAKEFTVAGKLERAGVQVSPLSQRKRALGRASMRRQHEKMTDSSGTDDGDKENDSKAEIEQPAETDGQQREEQRSEQQRQQSEQQPSSDEFSLSDEKEKVDTGVDSASGEDRADEKKSADAEKKSADAENKSADAEKAVADVTVAISNPDDEDFQAFFSSTSTVTVKSNETVDGDAFDVIQDKAKTHILSSTRKLRPARTKAAASRNPLKSLAKRTDVQGEYKEVITGVADKEMKRVKRQDVGKDASLASEALAALSAKEDFAAISLRKTDLRAHPMRAGGLQPYNEVMLIQVKGRRFAQVRIVAPVAASLNSGDCFILVTSFAVFHWIGAFSNVIERSKSADIAVTILQKKDLGHKGAPQVVTIEEEKQDARNKFFADFWRILGGKEEVEAAGPPDEDEFYEACVLDGNKIYEVDGEGEVMELRALWGKVLNHDILLPNRSLVFDFGSELYLWNGKQASAKQRSKGTAFLKKLAEDGYDFSDLEVNPLCPLDEPMEPTMPMQGDRPDWSIIGKCNENMETILFREKFTKWPDGGKLIKMKGKEKEEKEAEALNLTAADVQPMLADEMMDANLVLEGQSVGRGSEWVDASDGIKRIFQVETLGVKVWHVLEFEHNLLPEESHGHFHVGDTYVIRWQYLVAAKGLKSLAKYGGTATRSGIGRERCAYLFWQGAESSVNEKGASALMTVELDEERGPQVRVVQGKEPPAFLNLFGGKMVVYNGKRWDTNVDDIAPPSPSVPAPSPNNISCRLFLVRGDIESEGHLVEVSLSRRSLRSRGSFVLVSTKEGKVWVWHGIKTSKATRRVATECAAGVAEQKRTEMGFEPSISSVSTSACDEGAEPAAFWEALGVLNWKSTSPNDLRPYHSLIHSKDTATNFTPRLFQCTSVSGVYSCNEIPYSLRQPFPSFSTEEGFEAFPFPLLQSDLYQEEIQPAQFIIDNHHIIYVWQGWWPTTSEEEENVVTGSAVSRFLANLKCTLETALNYAKEKRKKLTELTGEKAEVDLRIVYAGVEPKEFQDIFPIWTEFSHVTESQLAEGRKQGQTSSVAEEFSRMTSTRYTLEELSVESSLLPAHVDPSRLEDYLQADEFVKVFNVDQETFFGMPQWKQANLKKEAGLF